jgi:putative DNA primase/helicase
MSPHASRARSSARGPGADQVGPDARDSTTAGRDRAELGSMIGSSNERESARAARRLAELEQQGRPANGHGADEKDSGTTVDFEDVRQRMTDLGNARRFVHHHGAELRHVTAWDTWLVWDGRRFVEDMTGQVARRVKQTVDWIGEAALQVSDSTRRRNLVQHWDRSQSAARLAAVATVAKSEPGIPVTPDELDADPWMLTVTNGQLDLRTGRLQPHDRSVLATKLSPVHFIPGEDAPNFRRFLDEVFEGDDDLIGFVQRFFGYCLTGDVSEQLMMFALGSGANGKSTLLGAVRHVLGDYAINVDPAIVTVGTHEQHPTAMTDLRGARLATTIETEQGQYLAEAKLKMLTGGDPVTARRMRQDFFTFAPSHKLVLAGNHRPRVRGTDYAIWRRIALVPFDVQFPSSRQDPHLAEKLRLEATGILAWMVEGCLEWQNLNHLGVPDRVKAATEQYRIDEDHIGRFLGEMCRVGPKLTLAAQDLRSAYVQWCSEAGEQPWSAKAVGSELSHRGFESAQVGRARTRTWTGLELADAAPSAPPR